MHAVRYFLVFFLSAIPVYGDTVETMVTGTHTQQAEGQKIFHSSGNQPTPFVAWSQSGATSGMFQQDNHFDNPAFVVQRTGIAGDSTTTPTMEVLAGKETAWNQPVLQVGGCLALSGDNYLVYWGGGGLSVPGGIYDNKGLILGSLSVDNVNRQLLTKSGDVVFSWGNSEAVFPHGFTCNGNILGYGPLNILPNQTLTDSGSIITQSIGDSRYALATGGAATSITINGLTVSGTMSGNVARSGTTTGGTYASPTIKTPSGLVATDIGGTAAVLSSNNAFQGTNNTAPNQVGQVPGNSTLMTQSQVDAAALFSMGRVRDMPFTWAASSGTGGADAHVGDLSGSPFGCVLRTGSSIGGWVSAQSHPSVTIAGVWTGGPTFFGSLPVSFSVVAIWQASDSTRTQCYRIFMGDKSEHQPADASASISTATTGWGVKLQPNADGNMYASLFARSGTSTYTEGSPVAVGLTGSYAADSGVKHFIVYYDGISTLRLYAAVSASSNSVPNNPALVTTLNTGGLVLLPGFGSGFTPGLVVQSVNSSTTAPTNPYGGFEVLNARLLIGNLQ